MDRAHDAHVGRGRRLTEEFGKAGRVEARERAQIPRGERAGRTRGHAAAMGGPARGRGEDGVAVEFPAARDAGAEMGPMPGRGERPGFEHGHPERCAFGRRGRDRLQRGDSRGEEGGSGERGTLEIAQEAEDIGTGEKAIDVLVEPAQAVGDAEGSKQFEFGPRARKKVGLPHHAEREPALKGPFRRVGALGERGDEAPGGRRQMDDLARVPELHDAHDDGVRSMTGAAHGGRGYSREGVEARLLARPGAMPPERCPRPGARNSPTLSSTLSGPAAPVPFETMRAPVHRPDPRKGPRRDRLRIGRLGWTSALGSIALGLVVSACKSEGANARVPLEVPNAVSGGTRGGGRPDSPSLERMNEGVALAEADKNAKAAAAKNEEAAKAEALWAGANATAARKPGSAADDYKKLADDHPDHIHADEARYLSAVNYMADGDWNGAVAALTQYMLDFPVNPHLREVERMLFDASGRVIEGARGFTGIFKSDKKGFDGLKALVERFPEGELPDDALLRLGDEYVKKDDAVTAALNYRELLMKYPASEWALTARLRLADTYLSRDQGAAYHAGYVDLDPRAPRTPQYAQNRPVVSCVQTALDNYQLFLTEDRPRASAEEIAYAEGRIAECRARLGAKDRSISAYYAGKGDATAASTYAELAEDVESGRPPSARLGPAAPAQPAVSPPGLGTTPAPLPPSPPRVITPTPPPAPQPNIPPPPPYAPPTPPPYAPPTPPPYVPPTPPRYVPPPPPRYVPPPIVPPSYLPPPAPPPTAAVSPGAPSMPQPLPPPRHIEGAGPLVAPK